MKVTSYKKQATNKNQIPKSKIQTVSFVCSLKFVSWCLFVSCILFLVSSSQAQQICPLTQGPPPSLESLEELKSIAVLEDGRIKPLETFARNKLLQFSGRTRLDKRPALDWLVHVFLGRSSIVEEKIFLINNPDVAYAIGIEPEEKRRYGFNQIEPGLAQLIELAGQASVIEPDQRNIVENEIIRLEGNVRQFIQLSNVFTFALVNDDFVAADAELLKELALPKGRNVFSFLEVMLKAEGLHAIIKDLDKKPRSSWSKKEQQALVLVNNLYAWSQIYQGLPLHVISVPENSGEWLSPWDALQTGLMDENKRLQVLSLADAFLAMSMGRQREFDISVQRFKKSVENNLAGTQYAGPLRRIPLELKYNKWNLFFYAQFFYFLAFLLFLISLTAIRRFMYRLAFGSIICGFILHGTGMAMRIIILQRPPVSTLYETFLFVGFVSVLVGIVTERVNKQGVGLSIAGVCGFIFLAVSGKFAAEGDTLKMLVAVLNSNFWLSTHVLSITTGYAGVCAAGIVGHIYIVQAIFRPREKQLLDSTHRILLGTLGFGLTMTFLGTNLGGIWADQSWGRFWGWDPKENGALLIILWTAILFHAKAGRLIGPLGLAVGSILGIIVVMWAWFGVNLLGVGLHSYGFTSGLATNLAVYVFLQLLFLVPAAALAHRKIKQK